MPQLGPLVAYAELWERLPEVVLAGGPAAAWNRTDTAGRLYPVAAGFREFMRLAAVPVGLALALLGYALWSARRQPGSQRVSARERAAPPSGSRVGPMPMPGAAAIVSIRP